jgi:hypothetical protein
VVFVCTIMSMTTTQLEEYIRSEIAQGTSFETIKNNLLVGGGWKVEEITNAYTTIIAGKKPRGGKAKVIAGALVLLVLAGLGYAYYQGYFTPLEQLTGQSFVAARNATSASFDTTITVDTSGLTASKDKNPIGELFGGSSSFTTKGSYDVSDPEHTKVQGLISLVFGSTSTALEFRVVDDNAYLQLTKAPTISFIPMLQSMENKWLVFPYKSEAKNMSMSPVTSYFGVDPSIIEKLTDDQKDQLYTITERAHFISITERLTPESINGDLSYHFTFDIDREGVQTYLAEVKAYINEIGKNDSLLSSFDPTSYGETLDKVTDFRGELWIAKSDKLPRKALISFATPIEEEGSIKVTITSLFKDWNVPVVVEKPEKSMTFQELMTEAFSGAMSMSTPAAENAGKNAAAKSTLANLRASAEIHYDGSATGSYQGACTSADFMSAKKKYGSFVCSDMQNAYAASVKLSDGTYYCVDSTGLSKVTMLSSLNKTSCANL